MDNIVLKGMRFYGYHGCLAEERRVGQPFLVDMTLGLDLGKAGRTDALLDTVDYGAVYECVKAIVEGTPYSLIEKVAAVIADTVLDSFPLRSVRVTVHKPQAPIGGLFEDVAVVIERECRG